MNVNKLAGQLKEEEDLLFESDYKEIIKKLIKSGHTNLLVKCYVNDKPVDLSIYEQIVSNSKLLWSCLEKTNDMFHGDIDFIRLGDSDFYNKLIHNKKYRCIDGVSLVNKKSTMRFRRFFINKEVNISVTVLHINISEGK